MRWYEIVGAVCVALVMWMMIFGMWDWAKQELAAEAAEVDMMPALKACLATVDECEALYRQCALQRNTCWGVQDL